MIRFNISNIIIMSKNLAFSENKEPTSTTEDNPILSLQKAI